MTDKITELLQTKALSDLVYTIAKPDVVTFDEPSNEKIEEVVGLLKDIHKYNGYQEIGELTGLVEPQLIEIHNKMKARIVELTPKTEEVL